MERVFDLVDSTEIPNDDPYIKSYPDLRDYFQSRALFTVADVVCGAHMVYGWMPTILTLNAGGQKESRLADAAIFLNKAKNTELEKNELRALSLLVNNSVVGTSKLLHFVEAERYAIWDSRVFRFVKNSDRCHDYQVNNLDAYMGYLAELAKLRHKPEFHTFYKKVSAKVAYEISQLRALELIMFLNAPKLTKKQKGRD